MTGEWSLTLVTRIVLLLFRPFCNQSSGNRRITFPTGACISVWTLTNIFMPVPVTIIPVSEPAGFEEVYNKNSCPLAIVLAGA